MAEAAVHDLMDASSMRFATSGLREIVTEMTKPALPNGTREIKDAAER